MIVIQFALYFGAVLSAALWLYFSISSRRSTDAKKRNIYSARVNIAMGTLLICIACVQLFLFSDTWIRLVVGGLFLLLGLFNLYAGLRNHANIKKELEP